MIRKTIANFRTLSQPGYARFIRLAIICSILLFSTIACEFSFQPKSATSAPPATEIPASTSGSQEMVTATLPAVPELSSPTATIEPTATVVPTRTPPPTRTPNQGTIIFPTSTPGDSMPGVAPGYYTVKIHNRYPHDIHVYIDGVYIMKVPSMMYMTYNGVKEGWRVFTFTKIKRKDAVKPVQIITTREINITGFTEIYVSP